MWLEGLRILFTFCEINMGLVADNYPVRPYTSRKKIPADIHELLFKGPT